MGNQTIPFEKLKYVNEQQQLVLEELQRQFCLDRETLEQVIDEFDKELKAGLLDDRSSDLNMIPSFVTGNNEYLYIPFFPPFFFPFFFLFFFSTWKRPLSYYFSSTYLTTIEQNSTFFKKKPVLFLFFSLIHLILFFTFLFFFPFTFYYG